MENYLCCNVVPCKNIVGSLCQNLGESKMKFPSNWNCVGNNLSVTHNHHHQARYAPSPTPTPTTAMFFNISLFQVAFLIFFSIFSIFTPDFLLVGLICFCSLWLYFSLQWQVNLMGAIILCFFFLIYSFSKLIMTCRLFVIYVREDNYSEL